MPVVYLGQLGKMLIIFGFTKFGLKWLGNDDEIRILDDKTIKEKKIE